MYVGCWTAIIKIRFLKDRAELSCNCKRGGALYCTHWSHSPLGVWWRNRLDPCHLVQTVLVLWGQGIPLISLTSHLLISCSLNHPSASHVCAGRHQFAGEGSGPVQTLLTTSHSRLGQARILPPAADMSQQHQSSRLSHAELCVQLLLSHHRAVTR